MIVAFNCLIGEKVKKLDCFCDMPLLFWLIRLGRSTLGFQARIPVGCQLISIVLVLFFSLSSFLLGECDNSLRPAMRIHVERAPELLCQY